MRSFRQRSVLGSNAYDCVALIGTDREDPALSVNVPEQMLPSLAREWERLVREGGHERREGHLDLVKSHIGDVPPVEEPARLAAWVGALINPIPALGVAYEIRPALLMARDTRGMLKVATEGITLSIERLRKSNGEQKNT